MENGWFGINLWARCYCHPIVGIEGISYDGSRFSEVSRSVLGRWKMEVVPLLVLYLVVISFVVKEICKGLLQRIFDHVAGI